jgi:altronate dehydratase small subunit
LGSRAIVLDKEDNVATATTGLAKEEAITVSPGSDMISKVLTQDIPYGHKFALKDIIKGEGVIKYGEVIGKATESIGKGDHAHIHNIEGLRGRGDRK